MQPVKIGILGLGTVGTGTCEVLHTNAREISRRAGRDIIISHAATRTLSNVKLSNPGFKISDNAQAVVDDPEISVVIELIGGDQPALDLVLSAIANGKHVVTANKALIALHGNEIFQAAQQQGVMVAFEAAVAGGIPIIKAIREGLAANHIKSIVGIINGTGNYIMTQMRDLGAPFKEVLADAQALGYAEADPTFDVEGVDAAHKLTILASIAFGIPLQFDRVYTEGISAITREDIGFAEELGYRIKHLGIARHSADGIELRVHPVLIPQRSLIANVNGVMNAVLVDADAVGQTMYYGAGAGALPTASAVVADLVDVVRSLTADPENRVPHLAFQANALSDLPVMPIEQIETAYYLRMLADDKPGVMSQVTGILGTAGISIEAVLQKEPAANQTQIPVIMLTHTVKETQMNKAIEEIEALPGISGNVTRIRVETLDHD